MINRQGLWFLTLFSLILVLSIYYITMPNEIFENEKVNTSDLKTNKKDSNKAKEVNKENTSYIETLKVELDSERASVLDGLQEVINDNSKSTTEKNKAYEQMKEINDTKAKEEEIVEKIKSKYNLEAYVKESEGKVEVVVNSKKHDVSLANKIMRSVQEEYDNYMQISVKFS